MKYRLSFAIGIALTLVICSATARAGEKRVNYNDLPPAVKETVQKESQGATIKGYSKEVENGKTKYEIEMTRDDKSRDILVDPSGKVIEVEQELALNDVPAAAMDANTQSGRGRLHPQGRRSEVRRRNCL